MPRKRFRCCVLLSAAMLWLAGCTTSTGEVGSDVAAVGVGTAVGAATGNPLIGLAAGLATRIGASEAVKYGQRRYYGGIQTAIAEAAGRAEGEETVTWSYDGLLGFGEVSGEVEVVRQFGRRFSCREIIFTVDEDGAPEIFVGVVCLGPAGWRWALARPSTERWHGLQ